MGSADACDQFAYAERLGDVVVGAKLERLNFFFLCIENRHHEHRQAWCECANAAKSFNAADARHIDVEQDHVDGSGVEQLQCFFPARSFVNLEAEFGQRRPQSAADGRFIVNDENTNGRLVH